MGNDKFQDMVIKKLDTIQIQLKEHGAILGALQHASEVHKADMDNLVHQVAATSGDLKAFRNETNDLNTKILAALVRIEEKVTGHDIKIEVLDRTKAAKRKSK